MSPITDKLLATDCFAFQRSLTNCQQRLHALNLPFHRLHSLCNAVGRQHSPRKPPRGAGRLLTSPDKKKVQKREGVVRACDEKRRALRGKDDGNTREDEERKI